MPDVAKFYGLQINRSGMACCPFQEERTPSLKVYDDHFYCFGCGATGDCTWLKTSGDTLSEYLTRLAKWNKIYAPKNFLEQPHPLFVESLTKRNYIEYLSEVLTYGSDKEKRQLYSSCREDIMKIRERLDKLAAAERTVKRKAI